MPTHAPCSGQWLSLCLSRRSRRACGSSTPRWALAQRQRGCLDTTPVSGRTRTVRKWRYERSREDSRRSSTRARVLLFHANVHTQYHTRSFGV